MGNEKDIIEANILNDDELDSVSGGKQVTENLVFKKSTKKKTSNALYSGESRKAGNLLYQDDDSSKRPSIPFDDGSKLC